MIVRVSAKPQVRRPGFTIVELLVVVVVIGILASITVTSYTGLNRKAIASNIQSDLGNASRLLKIDQVINGVYPDSLASANGGRGIPASSGTTYQYASDNSINPQAFCLSATKSSQSYKITNDSAFSLGDCSTYGLVLSLDAGDPVSYSGSGATWTNLGVGGNNGTLMNGVGYSSANGGTMVFDGVNDYVVIPNSSAVNPASASFSISMWFKMNSVGTWGSNILINKESVFESSAGGGKFSYAWKPYWTWSDAFNVNVAEWYYAVIVYDMSNQCVYRDGTLVYSRPQSGAMGSNTNEVDIGARNYGTTNFLPGTVGAVQIYNRPLSASEVQQNFNNQRSRYGI